MKVAGLFAGIGGVETGLSTAGHETVLLCEIWEPARAVLSSRFADIPCWDDITSLSSLPTDTEILSAGFPCQDLSQAGKTAGITGRRSSLVGEVFRLLDSQEIPLVLLENVSFMLQLERGRGMTTLVEAFEERGYTWAYRIVDTLSFLPQRRKRVLFLASKCDIDPRDVLLATEAEAQIPETDLDARAHGFYWTEGLRGLGWAVDSIPTLKNGSTVGIPSPPAILFPNGMAVTPDIRDAERLQGFPEDWTEPAEAVSRSSCRWSLVGNAVSVPVAQWFGSMLAKPEKHEKSREIEMPSNGKWPDAAFFDGFVRKAVQISCYPVWEERDPLASFLNYEGKLLSARATRGFLSRTERASLRFPEGFQARLRDHLDKVELWERGFPYEYAEAAE